MASQQNHNFKAIERNTHHNRRDHLTDRQRQRQDARHRLTELYAWRLHGSNGQTAHGIGRR